MAESESPWLSPDAVYELTAAKRWSTQCKRLAEMGIRFRVNAVGRPLVEKSDVLSTPKPKRKPAEPDWSALPKRGPLRQTPND